MSTEMITSDAAEAITALPRDLAIVKMENDQIFSLAAARPRNMEAIKEDLAQMIYNFPQFADEAIYEKPCGKDPDSGQMKYARGLSVRAAETLAECYGFNRIHTDVDCLPDGRVKIYASFTDYQKGRTWEDSTIVSPFYKGRNGAMQRHPEDRFLNVIVKSEKSKLVREVINRSVNQMLKAWFENECEKQLAKSLTEDACKKIITGFQSYGMNREQVEQVVGRPMAMGWTQQDKIRLTGVWNALKAGETTVAELLDQPAEKPKGGTIGGTVDGLQNPKGKAEQRPNAAPPEPAGDTEGPQESAPEPSLEQEVANKIGNAIKLACENELLCGIETEIGLLKDDAIRVALYDAVKARRKELGIGAKKDRKLM